MTQLGIAGLGWHMQPVTSKMCMVRRCAAEQPTYNKAIRASIWRASQLRLMTKADDSPGFGSLSTLVCQTISIHHLRNTSGECHS